MVCVGDNTGATFVQYCSIAVLQLKRRDQQLKAIPSWDKRINVHYVLPILHHDEQYNKHIFNDKIVIAAQW